MSRTEKIDESRRAFTRLAMTFGLSAAVCPLTALMLPESALAQPVVPLKVHNPHTDESYDIQLFYGDKWNRTGIIACDWVMRDWRENQTVLCDRKLYAALYVIQRQFGNGRVTVNSGYRSPKTNQMLRTRSIKNRGGVTWETPAINSQHCLGRAVDFKVEGVSPQKVAHYVQSLQLGGVGNYDTFTHMDTGRVRHWGPRS